MQQEIKAMTDQFTNEAIKSKYKNYTVSFVFYGIMHNHIKNKVTKYLQHQFEANMCNI